MAIKAFFGKETITVQPDGSPLLRYMISIPGAGTLSIEVPITDLSSLSQVTFDSNVEDRVRTEVAAALGVPVVLANEVIWVR